MTVQSLTETITVDGGAMVEQLRRRITGNNVQRVVVKQGIQPVAAFPAIGGMLSAAVQSAIGALAVALADCTIEIERVAPDETTRDAELDMIGIRWIGVAPIPEGIH